MSLLRDRKEPWGAYLSQSILIGDDFVAFVAAVMFCVLCCIFPMLVVDFLRRRHHSTYMTFGAIDDGVFPRRAGMSNELILGLVSAVADIAIVAMGCQYPMLGKFMPRTELPHARF